MQRPELASAASSLHNCVPKALLHSGVPKPLQSVWVCAPAGQPALPGTAGAQAAGPGSITSAAAVRGRMAATPPAATAGAAVAGTAAPKTTGPGEASSRCMCLLEHHSLEHRFLGQVPPAAHPCTNVCRGISGRYVCVPAGVLMSAGACETAAALHVSTRVISWRAEHVDPSCFACSMTLLRSCHVAQ